MVAAREMAPPVEVRSAVVVTPVFPVAVIPVVEEIAPFIIILPPVDVRPEGPPALVLLPAENVMPPFAVTVRAPEKLCTP